MIHRLAFAAVMTLAFLASLHPAPAAAVSAEWVRRWRGDLDFASDTLPRVHANLFHTLRPKEFSAAIDSLKAAAPALDHDEIAVGLAHILARVGDGHTRLTLPFDSTAGFFSGHSPTPAPLVPGLVFRHLPVRLGFFRDGLYVVRADDRHRDLLGGRVERIGTLSVGEAVLALLPVVHRDNESGGRAMLSNYLVAPEVLFARRVIHDRNPVTMVVATSRGRIERSIAPAASGTAVRWIDARIPGMPPLAEQRPEQRHWFTRIPGTHVLYARYREVMDDARETVAAFADSLFAELGRTHADRLILDVRGNVGGDGFLNRPIVHGAIASEKLRQPGALLVLADGGTFSAATMLQSELEQQTPALFLGTRSGGAPNGYGDSRRVRLPNTGLTMRVSTLYWQLSDPRDLRDGIPPHVEVESTFDDWRLRRDPAVDSALALAASAPPGEGTWRGDVSVGHQRVPITMRFTRRDSVDDGRAGPLRPLDRRRTTPVWDVEFESPALDAGPSRVASGVRSGPFAFTVRGGGAVLECSVRCAPAAITGVVRWRGSNLPFLLRNVDSP